MLKKYSLLTTLLVSMLVFTGCGEKEELTVFSDNMQSFYTEVSNLENAIAEIDASSENAVDTLLINMVSYGCYKRGRVVLFLVCFPQYC